MSKVCSVRLGDRTFFMVGEHDEIVKAVQNDWPLEFFEIGIDGSVTWDTITFFQPVDYVRTESALKAPEPPE